MRGMMVVGLLVGAVGVTPAVESPDGTRETAESDPAPVVEIVATRPHHTRRALGSPPSPEGAVVECRVHLAESSGAPPALYLYGMQTGGFVYARMTPTELAVGRWSPAKAEAVSSAGVPAPDWTSGWARVRFACAPGVVAAMAWPDGGPEPGGWQVHASVATVSVTGLAVGVWLASEGNSRATAWVDNARIRQPALSDGLDLLVPSPVVKPWPPTAAGPLVSETGACVVVLGGGLAGALDLRRGRWLRLTHQESGLEFLDPSRREPLFRLQRVEWPGGPARDITAEEFRRVEWRTAGAGEIEAEFRDGPVGIHAVRVRFQAAEDGILIRLAVECPTVIVSRVECPVLPLATALGEEGADDHLLIPHSHTDGIVVRAPAARDRRLGGRHPGDAAVQMMAVYDHAGGLLSAARDTGGEMKELSVVTRSNRQFTLSWAHDRPQVRGDVVLPYPLWLGAFRGDWRDAADLYKTWAKRQFWCARPLVERKDVPKFLLRGSAGVIYPIAGERGYNGVFGEDLEQLPELAREWRERLRVPHMLIVPYGWERRGLWAGINYFPTVPSDEAWEAAIRRLSEQGDAVAFLTSGFWWVVRRAATRNGPAFDDTADFERRREMVIAAPDGSPWFLDNYHKVGTQGDWRGWSVALCHGCAAARGTIREIFLRVAELGVPLISFDQEIGGRQAAACYSAQHDHPPGWGAWMWRDFTNLCAGIRGAIAATGRAVGLLTENCGEMIIPQMATFWSRQFGVADHATPGDETVGLFSYLYHEYVTAIAAAMVQGQGPAGSVPSPGLRAQAMANALVRGLIPCPFALLVPVEAPAGRRPPMTEAFLGFAPAFGTYPEFLLLGETLRPPEVVCDWREESYTVRGTGTLGGGRRVVVRVPNVAVGRFRAPGGAVATFFANPTDREQTAEFAPLEATRPAALRGSDGSVVTNWVELPARCTVVLPPYDYRVLVVPATGASD
ncbi:MAG: DUF6259 domain-containing protein [Kiritimatiellae bacterium]|nr:DUF6259 domain-containing protein [Kiritimatiellia bacterium]